MVKRDKEIKLRLSKSELEILNEKASLCKCNREKFLRLVLSETQLSIPPSLDYYSLIKEFNLIGNNLNQLVKLAYVRQFDKTQIEETLSNLNNLIALADKQIRWSGT